MELHDQTAAAHELVAVIVLDGLTQPRAPAKFPPPSRNCCSRSKTGAIGAVGCRCVGDGGRGVRPRRSNWKECDVLARRPVLLQELPHRCPRWIGVVEPRASRRVKQAVSPIARAIHLRPQIRSERILCQGTFWLF